MSINRYNYQEFFFLYIDNELRIAERKAVEDFIKQNQDLEEELLMMKQSILRPDVEVTFENKELLLQFDNETNPINTSNFSEFAVAYADDELSDTDKACLDEVVLNNPRLQQEFNLIKSLKLPTDNLIVFPGKKLLHRYEKGIKHVVLLCGRMAAAAVIVLFAGWLWLNERTASPVSPDIAQVTKQVPSKKVEIITENPERKTSNDASSRTDAFTHPAANNNENVAALEGKSSRINKKGMPESKRPGNDVTHREHNTDTQIQSSASTLIARAIDYQKLPKAVHFGNRSPVEQNSKPEAIAKIDGAIEKANERITDQPVVKINAINDHVYASSITVANSENEETALPDNIEKSSLLRGIFRKASRFIDKNTASRTSKKSGLLIGNIEIAFQ